MSFNKKYLQEREVLENTLMSNGSEDFYSLYVKKTDTFIGTNEAVEFIDDFLEKYQSSNTSFNVI